MSDVNPARDFRKRVVTEEESAQQNSRFMTWRPVAWMIYDHFKVSDTDGTVLDLPDLVKVEIGNDTLQSFDTKWDETIVAMREHPDEEIMENLYLSRNSSSSWLRCASETRFRKQNWKQFLVSLVRRTLKSY